MKCEFCKTKVYLIETDTSYSKIKIAWCSECGAFFQGGMNKSTREYYGHWKKQKRYIHTWLSDETK